MKQITCKFKSNGELITLIGVVTDDLTELSTSRKNQATDIIDDYIDIDGVWSLYFEISSSLGYEIQFKAVTVDFETHKTLEPVKAITWEGGTDGVITDEQQVTVKIRKL